MENKKIKQEISHIRKQVIKKILKCNCTVKNEDPIKIQKIK